ncbi:hypothetical protein HN873_015693 [Arachis hypogaea]
MSRHRCCHQRKPLSLTQRTELQEGGSRGLRLGKYKRDLYSLQKERENSQAMWNPDGKLITILVSTSEISYVQFDIGSLFCSQIHNPSNFYLEITILCIG